MANQDPTHSPFSANKQTVTIAPKAFWLALNFIDILHGTNVPNKFRGYPEIKINSAI